MIKIEEYKFSDKEIKMLQKYRDQQTDPRLKLRFISLLMIANGVDIKNVSSIIDKVPKTIENWLRQYIVRGIDSMNSFQYKPKKAYLSDEQIDEVVSWVKETNPNKTKKIKAHIKKNSM